MKRLLKIAPVIVVIFCACAGAFGAAGTGPNVLVMPFDDKTWEFKDSEEVLAKAAGEAVTASGKYRYISPDQFAANWLKALTDKERKLFGADPASQMKDLKQYRPMFSHADLGTLNEYSQRWGIDLVIIGEIKIGDDGEARLHSEIISMATGRLYAVSDLFSPEEAKNLMKKQVGLLLTKGAEVQKVEADSVIVPEKSIVGYDIRSSDGDYLRVVADYSSFRPEPELQKIEIIPHRPISDGILPLKVETKEKRPIKFQYFYRQGQLVNMKISADPPKEALKKDKEYEETLSVVSRGGYVIRFMFQWKDGEAKGIRVEPAVHPYGEVK
jgi:hypothetical protein